MVGKHKLAFLLFFIIVCNAFGSGFKINEQSLRSIALSSAYVAATYGADSSYFNPANMGFLDGVREDKHDLEVSLTAIYIPGFEFSTDTRSKQLGDGSINWGLTSTTIMKVPLSQDLINFAGALGINLAPLKDPIVIDHGDKGNSNQHGTIGYESSGAVVDGSADSTIFPVPKIFYKSKSFLNAGGGGFNAGVAFTAPSGLAMTWNGEAGAFLKDVMIAMVELSPSISYQWREIVGIGFSPRILYGMGNFNNTVYVPLQGDVLTNLKDYDEIPAEMIPEVMQQLIWNVNSGNGLDGFAGLFVGGGGMLNNHNRYNLPTLFSPDKWFGAMTPDELKAGSNNGRDVAAYNALVKESNERINKNYQQFKEWHNNGKGGIIDWRYNNKTCAGQDTICLPTAFNPVPDPFWDGNNTKVNVNGIETTAYKFVNGINYCRTKGNSSFYGCNYMRPIQDELTRLATEAANRGEIPHGSVVYINCYTGTPYGFDGKLQVGDPGPCNHPNPPGGKLVGYQPLMNAKQVAEAFGMGNMDIKTTLEGSTKVEQRSNGADLAFGYRAGITLRPINFKNYTLTISGVYDSPVVFKFKGKLNADTYIGGSIGDINMKADLSLETQLPAQLKIGIAQRIHNLTIELVYEKIWWAGGKKFEFAFSNPVFTALNSNSIIAGFSKEQLESMMNLANYDAVAMGRGWKDTSAYRLGLTYRFKGGTTLMGSVAYDQSPVPQDQIGIPDSTAYMFGAGINVPITENLSLGASATLYLKDNSESIYQSKGGGMGKLILANLSMGYSF